MKHSDIEGLTPIQIKTKYALPYTPTHYCYVNVPSGTKMYSGIVGENFGRVAGEAVKFELAKQIAENAFSSGISLP